MEEFELFEGKWFIEAGKVEEPVSSRASWYPDDKDMVLAGIHQNGLKLHMVQVSQDGSSDETSKTYNMVSCMAGYGPVLYMYKTGQGLADEAILDIVVLTEDKRSMVHRIFWSEDEQLVELKEDMSSEELKTLLDARIAREASDPHNPASGRWQCKKYP